MSSMKEQRDMWRDQASHNLHMAVQCLEIKDAEIARLHAENERLRGALSAAVEGREG